MGADTDLIRLAELARQLGYADPQDKIESVAWVAQAAPQVGENIVAYYEEMLSKDKTEVVVGKDDLDLREAEMYCFDANLRLMHSSGDLLALSVNAALNLGLTYQECSLGRVKKELAKTTDCGTVLDAMERFQDNDDWRYLMSFANTNKHLGVVLPEVHGFHIDADGVKHGWVMPEFKYTPQGKNAAEIHNDKMYRSELAGMRERQVQRVDDVLAEVLKVLEIRTP